MSVGEHILLMLSRPRGVSGSPGGEEVRLDEALLLLQRVYPDLGALVSGKRVVDFGCGAGLQGIALARRYGCSVVGVDSNARTLMTAARNATRFGASPGEVRFVEHVSPDSAGGFDVVISQNSFEHFAYPDRVLHTMGSLLGDGGLILLTFGPPWFAPFGSHMYFFCGLPWVNILFPEAAVLKARSHFRHDGARRYEEVESGLNRMTIRKFERIVASCGMRVRYRKYECVKRIDALSRLPGFRELFINHVSVILEKSSNRWRRPAYMGSGQYA